MISRCLAYAAVITSCSLMPASQALAEPRALIELFTSQGCSSCPPADKLLGRLVADPSLIAITEPIDVWDYLGWRDTLADPRNTARWHGYSKARGDRERYTPQVVVNGLAHAIGSDRVAIDKAIAKSRQNVAVMSVSLELDVPRDGSLSVTLPERSGLGDTDVLMLGLAKAITVAITRGENKGKTITYHNVVRHMTKLGGWNGSAKTLKTHFNRSKHDIIDSVAVLVQSGTTERPGALLGAAFKELAP